MCPPACAPPCAAMSGRSPARRKIATSGALGGGIRGATSTAPVVACPHGKHQGRRPTPPPGNHRRGPPRGLAGGRCPRRGLDLGLGPLLPALRRPRRRPLRGLHAARGHGRRDQPRAARRAGHVQLLPQPQPAGRHVAHHRPPERRTVRARHRVRVVRARLHRVRLRVRHRAVTAQGARPSRSPSSRSASPSSPRHRSASSRSSSAARGSRSRCGWSPSTPTPGTPSARPTPTPPRTPSSTSGAPRSAATPPRSSAPSPSARARSTPGSRSSRPAPPTSS